MLEPSPPGYLKNDCRHMNKPSINMLKLAQIRRTGPSKKTVSVFTKLYDWFLSHYVLEAFVT